MDDRTEILNFPEIFSDIGALKPASAIVSEFFLRQTFNHSNKFLNEAKAALSLPLCGLIDRERQRAYIKGYRAARQVERMDHNGRAPQRNSE